MPIDRRRRCQCHGVPMFRDTGRERHWHCTVKLRARTKFWNATPERKAQRAAYNKRRQIKIGERYVGYAASDEQAQVIRRHIKERLREYFEQGQFAGAATQVPSTLGVSLQAGPGPDHVRGKNPAAGDPQAEGRQVRTQPARGLRVRHRGAVR